MSNNVQVTLSCMADPRHHLRFGSCCRKFGGRDFHDVQVFQLSRLLDGESSSLAKEQLRPYRISRPHFSYRRWSACLSNLTRLFIKSRRRQLSSPLQTARNSSSDSVTRCCTTPSSEILEERFDGADSTTLK